MSTNTTPRIPAAEARRLCVEAHVDPRTLAKAATGKYIRGDAGTRARTALIAAGYLPAPSGGATAAMPTFAAGKEAARS